MYGFLEVKHDYHVSKDSKGSEHNKKWHFWDMIFHLSIAILLTINVDWKLGLFLILTRGLLFDRIFSYVWTGDWFYVGENEPKIKKKYIKVWVAISLILWITNFIILL